MIRCMTGQDLGSAQEVILAAHKGVMYDLEPFLRLCLSEKAELSLVAESNGQLTGVIIGSLLGVLGMIDVLAVSPNLQGQGIGLALVEALGERLGARGARKLVVLSWDHSEPFYEKLGFRTDPGIHFMSRGIESPIEAQVNQVPA